MGVVFVFPEPSTAPPPPSTVLQIHVTTCRAKNPKYAVWTTRGVPGACARNSAAKSSYRCAGPTAGRTRTNAFYGGRRVEWCRVWGSSSTANATRVNTTHAAVVNARPILFLVSSVSEKKNRYLILMYCCKNRKILSNRYATVRRCDKLISDGCIKVLTQFYQFPFSRWENASKFNRRFLATIKNSKGEGTIRLVVWMSNKI